MPSSIKDRLTGTPMDRAILNVLKDGPQTVRGIEHQIWYQTGLIVHRNSVQRCTTRLAGLGLACRRSHVWEAT